MFVYTKLQNYLHDRLQYTFQMHTIVVVLWRVFQNRLFVESAKELHCMRFLMHLYQQRIFHEPLQRGMQKTVEREQPALWVREALLLSYVNRI